MKRFGLPLLVAALAAPAMVSAEPSGDATSLSCRGTLASGRVYEARLGADLDAQRAAAKAQAVRFATSAEQMSVAIQPDGVVMVKPRGALKPAMRSDAGWYRLTDVAIDGALVSGTGPRGIELLLNQRTGAIRFGDYNGACAPT